MDWVCPRCKRPLVAADETLNCRPCRSVYESVAGIYDFRIDCETWIDRADDRATASRLAIEMDGMSAAEAVRHVFASRAHWTAEEIELRTRQTLDSPQRARRELDGWLKPVVTNAEFPFLDLGCGPGALLAAAAAQGRQGIGIDVSLLWLVVARKLIEEYGGRPLLAAACAEALPLRDESVSSVVSLDVIEHVMGIADYLREVDRVTRPGGHFACSTPNRFSLAAEPHVHLWGVGWLPRSLQKPYVRWRCRRDYVSTRLLSSGELNRLLRKHTHFHCRISPPPVPEDDMARFSTRRALLARLYNFCVRLSPLRWLWLRLGPFFHVVGQKPAPSQIE